MLGYARNRGELTGKDNKTVVLVDSDGYQDLVSEGLDLWIRLGDVAASTLITRSLSHSPRVAVATVEYLRRVGEPMHPTDLSRHECIIFTGRSAATAARAPAAAAPAAPGSTATDSRPSRASPPFRA